MYSSKKYILEIIEELDIFNMKIEENNYTIKLELGLQKKSENKHQAVVSKEIDWSKPVKHRIKEATYNPTTDLIDTNEIINSNDDILTKDLEECNEGGLLRDVKSTIIVTKKDIKAGEPIYPNDFELEHEEIKKPTKKRRKTNFARGGYRLHV